MRNFFKNLSTVISILFNNKILRRPDFSEKKIFLNGKILENQILNKKNISSLSEVEFSVFSQFGEDGIISWLSNQIPDIKKIFLEIGTQDYWESNTRYLLKSQLWKGYLIEGLKEDVNKIKKQRIYWQNNLTAICKFLNTDNINETLDKNIKEKNIGLLSIDIDGNDYWILDKIQLESDLVVLEYNPIFGDIHRITIPYEENFERNKKHFSNMYFGCSIKALISLMKEKNYIFLGTNSQGMNAFFVSKSKYIYLKDKISNRDIFPPLSRDARNIDGKLNFKNLSDNLKLIKDLEVYDLDKKTNIKLSEYKNFYSEQWSEFVQ